MHILGIDIGGSGIKGAIIDVATGRMVTPRQRIATPQPATPQAVVTTTLEVVHHFGWDGPVGCGFPAVIKGGIVRTAANIHPAWIGLDGQAMFAAALTRPLVLLNDADAAGLAEMRFGAGRERGGTVLMLTLGTGIGSALFVDGYLVPNTELGHIEIRGKDAERRASEGARDRRGLSFRRWAKYFDEYLHRISSLIWPDLIIIGGGGSKNFDQFAPLLTVKVEMVAAVLRNEAGMVGAALAAHQSIQV